MKNDLGIFFIMFQSQLNGYVKCWIDGSENYEFLDIDSFFALVKKTDNIKLISIISNAIDTTSIYLWNVLENKVRRLSPSTEYNDIAKMISEAKENYKRHHGDEMITPLSGITYNDKIGIIELDIK